MQCFGGFEANAQNLRIIARLETKSEEYDGLNLTRAVAWATYKEPFDGCRKKFVYQDDMDLVAWASEEACADLPQSDMKSKSFECQIMDWADDVAYAVHDLEDSIHTEYIGASIFYEDRRNKEAIDEVAARFSAHAVDVEEVHKRLIYNIRKQSPEIDIFRTSGNHAQQKASRKRLTSYLIGRYIKGTSRTDRHTIPVDFTSQRYSYEVCVPVELQVEVALINKLVRKYVIDSPQIRALEEKGRHIVRSLFSKFMQDNNAFFLLPDDWKGYLVNGSVEGHSAQKARVVSDYISGMSDAYAQKLYSKLFLPNHGSIYEIL